MDTETTPGDPYFVEATVTCNATSPKVVFRGAYASVETALGGLLDAAESVAENLVTMPNSVSITSRRVRWEHLAGDLEEDWSDYSEHALLGAWRRRFAVPGEAARA